MMELNIIVDIDWFCTVLQGMKLTPDQFKSIFTYYDKVVHISTLN